jgi:hypothetical protein
MSVSRLFKRAQSAKLFTKKVKIPERVVDYFVQVLVGCFDELLTAKVLANTGKVPVLGISYLDLDDAKANGLAEVASSSQQMLWIVVGVHTRLMNRILRGRQAGRACRPLSQSSL